jgi:hypothetical protein
MIFNLANSLALGLLAFAIPSAATPVPADGQIARRTVDDKCSYVQKNGIDFGCVCSSTKSFSYNFDFDFNSLGLFDIDLSYGITKYPSGCRPTCDVSTT